MCLIKGPLSVNCAWSKCITSWSEACHLWLKPLWIFSQSDACRVPTTTVSRSAASSVRPALSRRKRGSWPVTSAPAVTATGLSGRETSPPAQVVWSPRDDVLHESLIYWCVLNQTSLHCLQFQSRPMSNRVLLQRWVQTLSAVPSGRLPTRSGTDPVLPLWGRLEHQAGRCQFLPWLWSQRSVLLILRSQRRKIYSKNLQHRPHLMCIFILPLQFSVLQVITTTPQFTGVSAAQWGLIRQSLDRTTVFPAPGTPPLISMVPQVSRSARVSVKITVLCFLFMS